MVPTSARPVLLNRSSPQRASSGAASANSAQFMRFSFRPHPELRASLPLAGKGPGERIALVLLQRGRVALREAELAGLEEAAHDLAAAGLGQRGHELDLAGGGAGAQLLAAEADKLAAELIVRLIAVLEGDERLHDLHRHRVGLADDAGLGDCGVLDEGALHLERADEVAGGVDHVVGAADERSEEHTSELQSRLNLLFPLL